MRKIRRNSRIVTTIVFLQIIILLISGVAFILPNENEEEYHLILGLIASWGLPKNITFVLYWVYRLHVLFCYWSTIVNTSRVVYICTHIKLQLWLFLQKLTDISTKSGYNDPDYQVIVGRRLTFCVQRHVEFLV